LLGGGALAAAVGVAALVLGTGNAAPSRVEAAETSAGQAIYEARCATCHNQPEATRSPALSVLRQMPAQQITLALTQGVMKPMAAGLSESELKDLVGWLAAPVATTAAADWVEPLRCAADKRTVDPDGKKTLTVWGVDPSGSRRMTAAQSGLSTAALKNLEVAWSVAFPQTTGLRSQGAIVGSTLFYAAGQTRRVLAMDTQTGCVKWAYEAGAPIRSSLTYGPLGDSGRSGVIFADSSGTLHAVDPATGVAVWTVDPRHDKSAPITGAPVLYRDKIIVPISAGDVARAMNPQYACCTGHGAVVAVDAATGESVWTAHTMEDAKPLGRKTSAGVEMWGPSGAPIWSTPTIDAKRGLVYATTGENTSEPATKTSDAVMAIDLKTGETRWVFQALGRDIWNMSCGDGRKPGANCPWTKEESELRDFDFGAGAILAKRANGRDVILAGQKSGHVWALDPDAKGKVLWSRQFGQGTALGGIHWGIATDGRRVFAAINDPIPRGGTGEPGLNAVDINTGEVLWRWAAKPDCGNGRAERVAQCAGRYGLSAAPLVVDGAVLAGSIDGKLRVFDAATGAVLFEHDTAQPFESRNGVAGKGGAIDSHSVFAGDGMVFVGSGYGSFGQQAGNVLLAYRPKRS
jgi:polyvinyl alcohol dehydrogenase (cytochrome)